MKNSINLEDLVGKWVKITYADGEKKICVLEPNSLIHLVGNNIKKIELATIETVVNDIVEEVKTLRDLAEASLKLPSITDKRQEISKLRIETLNDMLDTIKDVVGSDLSTKLQI